MKLSFFLTNLRVGNYASVSAPFSPDKTFPPSQ